MKVELTDRCPCGSGRPFANCCLPKAADLTVLATAVPFLQLPLSIHCMVVVSEFDEPEAPPFWPIVVVGKSIEDVQFCRSGNSMNGSQLIRLGFCNSEFRLLAQIRTESGTYDLIDNAALGKGVHRIVASFDVDHVDLIVNEKLVGTRRYQGLLPYSAWEDMRLGWGGSGQIIYCNVLRKAILPSEVKSLRGVSIPSSLVGWDRGPDGCSRLIPPSPGQDIASTWLSYQVIEIHSDASFVDRVLHRCGELVSKYGSKSAAVAAVGNKLSILTDLLSTIIEDDTKTERDLLDFFALNPAAIFLLEPDYCRQWREKSIQEYGQIDFVCERFDGTFLVLEIESHLHNIFTKKGELTQPVQHAINQVERWVLGASKSTNITRLEYGVVGGEHFIGVVVIGRSADLDNEIKREAWLLAKKRISMYTWDDIVKRGRVLVKRLADPELARTVWQ